VLFVTVDPVEKNLDLAASLGIGYHILSDPDLEVIDAYGVRHVEGGLTDDIARPATFIIDREGTVVWRDLTENWRIRVRPDAILNELAKLP